MKALLLLLFAAVMASLQSLRADMPPERWLIVSVADQELVLFENGVEVRRYPVSTSRFGLGDGLGSYRTPLGELQVAQMIGTGAPSGAVFKGRRFTGEILGPNAIGRDPIVSRIIWLRGMQSQNANAYSRGIYIHGTPVERLIGRPVSYGCVRMRSRDVIELYQRISIGTRIQIVNGVVQRTVRRIASRAPIRRLEG